MHRGILRVMMSSSRDRDLDQMDRGSLRATVSRCRDHIEHLELMVLKLRRDHYGPSSEWSLVLKCTGYRSPSEGGPGVEQTPSIFAGHAIENESEPQTCSNNLRWGPLIADSPHTLSRAIPFRPGSSTGPVPCTFLRPDPSKTFVHPIDAASPVWIKREHIPEDWLTK